MTKRLENIEKKKTNAFWRNVCFCYIFISFLQSVKSYKMKGRRVKILKSGSLFFVVSHFIVVCF